MMIVPVGYYVVVDGNYFYINGIEKKLFKKIDFNLVSWTNNQIVNDFDPEFFNKKYWRKISKRIRKFLSGRELSVYILFKDNSKKEI